MDAREILRFVRIILAAALLFLIDCPPTVLQDDLAACRKNLCAGSDFDLRCEKFLRRIELRDVGTRYKSVQVFLFLGERGIVWSNCRRDDCMMRRNLFIVPCTASDLPIRICCEERKICAKRSEMVEDRVFVRKLVLRQIVAVGARIAREFLLIKCLLRVENFLWGVAVDFSRVDLKRRERVRQSLRACALFLLHAANTCSGSANGSKDLFCNFTPNDASLCVYAVHLTRLPFGEETSCRMLPENPRREKCDWAKFLDLDLAAHDKPHRRGLHSADADGILIPCFACTDGIDA